eukprot:gene11890-13122_t
MAKVVKKTYSKKAAWETAGSRAFDEAKIQTPRSEINPKKKLSRPNIWAKVPLFDSQSPQKNPLGPVLTLSPFKNTEKPEPKKRGRKRKDEDLFGFGDLEDDVAPAVEYISPKKKKKLEEDLEHNSPTKIETKTTPIKRGRGRPPKSLVSQKEKEDLKPVRKSPKKIASPGRNGPESKKKNIRQSKKLSDEKVGPRINVKGKGRGRTAKSSEDDSVTEKEEKSPASSLSKEAKRETTSSGQSIRSPISKDLFGSKSSATLNKDDSAESEANKNSVESDQPVIKRKRGRPRKKPLEDTAKNQVSSEAEDSHVAQTTTEDLSQVTSSSSKQDMEPSQHSVIFIGSSDSENTPQLEGNIIGSKPAEALSYIECSTLSSNTQETETESNTQTSVKSSKGSSSSGSPFKWFLKNNEKTLSPKRVVQLRRISVLPTCTPSKEDDRGSNEPVAAVPFGMSWTMQTDSDDAVKVNKQDKELFTIVRNTKQAHESVEFGESQQFKDDVDYLLDGIGGGNSLSTRCLSLLELASKCSKSAFRMHLRAHDVVSLIFDKLSDAPSNQFEMEHKEEICTELDASIGSFEVEFELKEPSDFPDDFDVYDLNGKCEDLSQSNRRLEEKVRTLSASLVKAGVSVRNVEQRLSSQFANEAKMKNIVKQMEQYLCSSDDEVEELQREVCRLKEELFGLKQEKEQLEMLLKEASEQQREKDEAISLINGKLEEIFKAYEGDKKSYEEKIADAFRQLEGVRKEKGCVEEELANAVHDADTKKKRILELTQSTEKLSNKLMFTQDKLSIVLSENSRMEEDLGVKERALKDVDEENQDCKKYVKDLERLVREKEGTNKTIFDQLELSIVNNSKIEDECKKLQGELDDSDGVVFELKRQLSVAVENSEKLNEEVMAKNTEVDLIKHDCEVLKKSFDDAMSKNVVLELEVSSSESSITRLEKEIHVAKEAERKMSLEMAKKINENEALCNAEKVLAGRINQIEAVNADLSKSLEKVNEKLRKSDGEKKASENELQALASEFRELEVKYASMEKAVKEKEVELTSAAELKEREQNDLLRLVKKLKKTVKNLRKEDQVVKDKMLSLEVEKETLSSDFAWKNAELGKSLQLLRDLEKELRERSCELVDVTLENGGLKGKIGDINDAKERMACSLNMAAEKEASFRHELQNLQEKCDEMTKKIQDSESQCCGLSDRNDELNRLNEKLKRDFERLKVELGDSRGLCEGQKELISIGGRHVQSLLDDKTNLETQVVEKDLLVRNVEEDRRRLGATVEETAARLNEVVEQNKEARLALEKQVESHVREIAELEKSNAGLKLSISKLEERVSGLKVEKDTLNAEMADLRGNLERKMFSETQLKEKLCGKTGELKEASEQLDNERLLVKTKEEELLGLVKQLEAAKERIEDLSQKFVAERKVLGGKVEKWKEMCKVLQEEKKDLLASKLKIEEDFGKRVLYLESCLCAEKEELSRFGLRFQEKKAELDAVKSKVQKLSTDNSELRRSLEAQKVDLERRDAVVTELQNKLVSEQTSSKTLREILSSTECKLSMRCEEDESVTAMLKSAQTDVEYTRHALKTVEVRNLFLETTKVSLEAELQKKDADLRQIESELSRKREEETSLLADMKNAKLEAKKMARDKELADKQRKKLELKLLHVGVKINSTNAEQHGRLNCRSYSRERGSIVHDGNRERGCPPID